MRLNAALFALTLIVLLCASNTQAFAQAAACTNVASGTSQDITAYGECRKVTFSGLADAAGVCAVTGTDLAQWQSFYNNPPAGVSIAACSGGCAGYSYGGYCYYWAGDMVSASCDTVCASRSGCNAAGTRFIGSDDSGGTRCSAVTSAFTSTALTATTGTGSESGCFVNNFKGGWLAGNMYSPTTTCADASTTGRACACNS